MKYRIKNLLRGCVQRIGFNLTHHIPLARALNANGIIGQLLGFDVVINKYLDNSTQATAGSAGTTSFYPMYFGDWQLGHSIIDRMDISGRVGQGVRRSRFGCL